MNLRLTLISNLLLASTLIGNACAVQHQTLGQQDAPVSPGAAQTERGAEKQNVHEPSSREKYEFKKYGALVYDRGKDYRLTLDIYQPQGEGPFPAVLAIHGGAWRSGSKITMLRHAWALASAGYVVVAINYRHAPEHKFPAQIHDCKQAIRWIRYHADRYGIDKDKVAAFGYSAGGHLASLLGSSNPQDGLEGPIKDERLKDIPTRIQAVIAGGAVCDFDWVAPDSNLLKYWLGNNRATDPAVYQRATPIHYLSKTTPPFLFFHGDQAAVVPISSPLAMHQKLIDMGLQSEFHTASGKGHLATFGDLRQMKHCIEFLDRNFLETETPPKSSEENHPTKGN